jgi:hypothetical protein
LLRVRVSGDFPNYFLLVFIFHEAALDAQSLISCLLSAGVAYFLLPHSPPSLFDVALHFLESLFSSQFANAMQISGVLVLCHPLRFE